MIIIYPVAKMGNGDDMVNNTKKFIRLNDLMLARHSKKRT